MRAGQRNGADLRRAVRELAERRALETLDAAQDDFAARGGVVRAAAVRAARGAAGDSWIMWD